MPGADERRSGRLAALAVVAFGLIVGGVPLLVGPPGGDDAYYHAMRAQQHARCWRLGALLPRWYPDLNAGLGGPEPRAYPLAPLVIHAGFALATDGAVTATSAATLLVPVVAGLCMLGAARRRGVSLAGAAAVGAVWAIAPYLVIALHERVALAEGWALAILPLVIEALVPPAPEGRRAVLRAALGFAVLLACQLPLALMVALLVGGLHLLRGRRGRPVAVLAAGGLGLCLAAVSWLPNLGSIWRLQGEALLGEGYRWTAHLLPWGSGEDTVLLGHLTLALVGTAAAGIITALSVSGTSRALALTGLVALAFTTPLASWAYRWVPGLAFLQFPWRWLGPAGVLVLLAVVAVPSRPLRVTALVVFLVPLATSAATRWRLEPGGELRPSQSGPEAALSATRYGVPAILPSLPAYLPRGVDLAKALHAAGPARQALEPPAARRAQETAWVWESDRSSQVTLPLLADDGWRVEVDGHPVGWVPADGLVGVAIPAGRHAVRAVQSALPEEIAGRWLTGIAALAFGVAWRRK